MLGTIQYLAIIKLVFFVFIILSACIYSIPILFIKRFRSPMNILTANVCITCIVCSIYWIMYALLQLVLSDDLNNWNCVLFQYFQTIVNCQEIYALSNVSINRFCIIFYNNKLLFKTRRWVLTCIGIQWLIGVILPLPLFSISNQTCGQYNQPLWLRIYVLLITIIVPSVLFLLINGMILFHAHSSRQRVAPSNTTNHISLVNSRDIRLTKRMLILLLLFLFGWCPVYIVFTIQNSYNMWLETLKLLPEFSLLGEVINLFLYNRKLRLYLKDRLTMYI